MSSVIPPDLWNAYFATTFCTDIDGVKIRIRVGATHPDLDRLARDRRVEHWAYVTAWNPSSRELTAEENDARHIELKHVIACLGFEVFEGWGEPDAPGWSREKSLLVFGIAESNAVALGRRFGQTAIVVGRRDGFARLVPCVDEMGAD